MVFYRYFIRVSVVGGGFSRSLECTCSHLIYQPRRLSVHPRQHTNILQHKTKEQGKVDVQNNTYIYEFPN